MTAEPSASAAFAAGEEVSSRAIGSPANLNLYSATNDIGFVYTRNPSLWMPMDFTCIPVWSSSSGTQFNGVLVTPDILIQANHAHSTGTVYFVAMDGTVHSRTITGGLHPTADLFVARLDSPLPPAIAPARILPQDFHAKLPQDQLDTHSVLSVFSNSAREIRIGELAYLDYYNLVKRPVLVQFQPWYTPIVSGDSGSPAFLIIDDQTVVLGVWHGSNSVNLSNAPGIHFYKSDIDAAIISLGSATQMTEVDLRAYLSY